MERADRCGHAFQELPTFLMVTFTDWTEQEQKEEEEEKEEKEKKEKEKEEEKEMEEKKEKEQQQQQQRWKHIRALWFRLFGFGRFFPERNQR